MTQLRWLFIAVMFFSVPKLASAQITITADDLLSLLGGREVQLLDQRESFSIDVGSPGANQVWDFRNQVIGDSLLSYSDFMSPDETTSASTFPESNLVEKITSPGFPVEIFNFYQVGANSLINRGDSTFTSLSGMDTSIVTFQFDTLAPLPLTFGESWITTERDTTGFYPDVANISIDTTYNTIDAWGTVRVPLGDFECLRLQQRIITINQTILNGQVFSTDVDSSLQYNWIAKGVLSVASAQSQFGDTNPNFSNAQSFSRIDSLSNPPTTAVRDNGAALPLVFDLFQNYPNPFNPETAIAFNLRQQGHAELAIYNLLGERVRTLHDGVLAPGTHTMSWDGRDDAGRRLASGIYLYRLISGGQSVVRRMVLLQ